MGYGGGGGGGGGSGGSGGGSGASGGSGYRRIGDDRTANLFVDNITNREESSGTKVDGIVEAKGTHFIPPSGTTTERGSRGRGLFGGGRLAPTPSTVYTNSIEYITIATLGNTSDFGDFSSGREHVSGSVVASSIRGIWAGGYGSPTGETDISYVTISSTGNSFDFGDLTANSRSMPSHSNNTRGIFGPCNRQPTGGNSQIQYITIATTGNAAEFGSSPPSLSNESGAGVGDSTRAVFCGGYIGPNKQNIIHYVTISSFGDSVDFGDLTDATTNSASSSGSGRGLIAGGRRVLANPSNIIDYITIQSLGNALDFGDLTSVRNDWVGGASNGTRAVFAGGDNPSYDDTMDYVEIMTTGNAQDFGNLSAATRYKAGCSDSHGGLG